MHMCMFAQTYAYTIAVSTLLDVPCYHMLQTWNLTTRNIKWLSKSQNYNSYPICYDSDYTSEQWYTLIRVNQFLWFRFLRWLNPLFISYKYSLSVSEQAYSLSYSRTGSHNRISVILRVPGRTRTWIHSLLPSWVPYWSHNFTEPQFLYFKCQCLWNQLSWKYLPILWRCGDIAISSFYHATGFGIQNGHF